jgi:hypothetical protein
MSTYAILTGVKTMAATEMKTYNHNAMPSGKGHRDSCRAGQKLCWKAAKAKASSLLDFLARKRRGPGMTGPSALPGTRESI